MRVELHNREGKKLGVADLVVTPAELQQALHRTLVVVGPVVQPVDVVLCGEAIVAPVATSLAVGAKTKRKKRRL